MVWINVKRPTPSKESAVNLAFLAYILDKAAPFYGKTKIVKTAFRVELALRDQGMIGPTFRFYRYKKGPFSVELLNAYDTLWSRGFAKNFALTERGKRLSKFMETLKRIPHNRSVFNVMDAALERCRIQHGSRMMDDLYEIRVRPEDGKDKVVLKDIPMNTDIVAPKGDPTVNIPSNVLRAIVDELEITDEEVQRAEKDWPNIEARALGRLHAAISATQPKE